MKMGSSVGHDGFRNGRETAEGRHELVVLICVVPRRAISRRRAIWADTPRAVAEATELVSPRFPARRVERWRWVRMACSPA